jgi:hypothetical protein
MSSCLFNDVGVTIASGQSLSAAVCVGAGVPIVLTMPDAWTAADITFQTSHDGVTYRNLYDGVNEVKITSPVAGTNVPLDAISFAAARFVKVRSGTSAAAVNQGADRALEIIARKELR